MNQKTRNHSLKKSKLINTFVKVCGSLSRFETKQENHKPCTTLQIGELNWNESSSSGVVLGAWMYVSTREPSLMSMVVVASRAMPVARLSSVAGCQPRASPHLLGGDHSVAGDAEEVEKDGEKDAADPPLHSGLPAGPPAKSL
jgi:hypothetical protein